MGGRRRSSVSTWWAFRRICGRPACKTGEVMREPLGSPTSGRIDAYREGGCDRAERLACRTVRMYLQYRWPSAWREVVYTRCKLKYFTELSGKGPSKKSLRTPLEHQTSHILPEVRLEGYSLSWPDHDPLLHDYRRVSRDIDATYACPAPVPSQLIVRPQLFIRSCSVNGKRGTVTPNTVGQTVVPKRGIIAPEETRRVDVYEWTRDALKPTTKPVRRRVNSLKQSEFLRAVFLIYSPIN